MRIRTLWGVLGCLLICLSGCGFGQQEEESAAPSTPTMQPVPTFTPSPVRLATPTSDAPPASAAIPTSVIIAENAVEAISETFPIEAEAMTVTIDSGTAVSASTEVGEESAMTVLLPTITPDSSSNDDSAPSGAALRVIVDVANVRAGPDIAHLPVGTALRDAEFAIVGRNEGGNWWQVCCFDGQPGWLFESVVEVQNIDAVTVVAVPPPELPTPAPVALVEEQGADVAAPDVAEAPSVEDVPAPEVDAGGTAGSFDPNSQYHIVHYRVLGFDDNNGGIFNKGGQQLIFLTVLDGAGNPMDGVVVKDAVGDKLTVVTGSKGPGKVEIKMDWDPYKLYVASDPAGAVTSHISNQMNNPYPHIPDVVGRLGPPENEYAICPTVDDRCTPPFYHAHWSYEITFQKVR